MDRYEFALGGIFSFALGIALLTGLSMMNGGARTAALSTPAARTGTEIPRYFPGDAQRNLMVFYIVNTDAQAEAARQTEDSNRSELMALGHEFPRRSFAIYKVLTAQEEANFDQMVADTRADLDVAGLTDVIVLDLRER
jgi:hypothetical protein